VLSKRWFSDRNGIIPVKTAHIIKKILLSTKSMNLRPWLSGLTLSHSAVGLAGQLSSVGSPHVAAGMSSQVF